MSKFQFLSLNVYIDISYYLAKPLKLHKLGDKEQISHSQRDV